MARDPEETAAGDAAITAEGGAVGHAEAETPPAPIVTSVIIWRALLFVPFALAAALAVIAVRLGSPLAALLLVFVAVLYGVAVRRRVARYRFDDAGALHLEGDEEPLDWTQVTEVRVGRVSPWMVPRARRDLEVNVVDVRIGLRDGTVIRFARGDHLLEAAGRRPLGAGVFPAWLEGRAREAGLAVERLGDVDWIARR